MDFVLDDDLLSGEYAVQREVGPALLTAAVDAGSIADASDVIERLCCFWGGGCSVLLPVDPGARTIEQPWLSLVQSHRLDEVSGRGLIDDIPSFRALDVRHDFEPQSEPLLTMLASGSKGDRVVVDLSLPEPADPWWIAYAGCLGSWPDAPPSRLVQLSGLVPDLAWDQLLSIRKASVLEPSGQDLLGRLRASDSGFARHMSLYNLALRSAAWTQDLVSKPRWTDRHWLRGLTGCNIVVIYEAGSVADLCLLWNLRSAHGLNRGLPLAVPVEANVVEELGAWSMPETDGLHFAPKLRGFDRPWALVSMSVPMKDLEALANAASGPWKARRVEDVLQPPYRASRPSADVALFSDGKATVATTDSSDRELLQQRPPTASSPSLRFRMSVLDRPVPALGALRDSLFLARAWRSGGFDGQLSGVTDTAAIEWPDRWTLLRAAISEHGIEARPSRPGRAVMALLHRLGSFDEIEPLKHDQLLAEIDRLGERQGISWFRGRIREMQGELAALSSDAAARSERIEQLLEEHVVPPTDDEQHELTASRLTSAIGREGASAWLGWAESRGLVVRGVRVGCDRCGAKGWRPALDLAPPITCSGCGQPIARPFPSDTLTFRYRASRLLVEVLAVDGMSHLLGAAWWVALMRSPHLIGVHPGVEFVKDGQVIGEADLLLLFEDGRVAIGECKRRQRGLSNRDLDGLESLADRLDAAWTFVATPDWAENAPPLWRDLRHDLPQRRRFALCGEQLLSPARDIWESLGGDSTAWNPIGEADREQRRTEFAAGVGRLIQDLEKPQTLADWLVAHDQSFRAS